jgi:drug/metabolite transporter (DMT)-like permease
MAAPAALATTVVLWASAFAAIREAVRALGWAHLSFLRLAVAALVLGALAAVRRVGWPARRDLPLLALCALSGMTAYQVLLNAGEVTVPAATASLLVNVAPIFTALLAAALLGERLTAMGWCGVALGFAGAALIAVAAGGGVHLSGGALLVLGAAAAQATFFVSQKALLRGYGSLAVTAWAMGLGAAMALPLAPGLAADVRAAPTTALLAVGFLALGASALGLPDLGLRRGARRRHRGGQHALRGAAGRRPRRLGRARRGAIAADGRRRRHRPGRGRDHVGVAVARITRTTSCGSSHIARWPQSGSSTVRQPVGATTGGRTSRSCSPHASVTGTSIPCAP